MNKAKFINIDNGSTVIIYVDSSKSTNHVELYNFFGGNYNSYIDYNGIERNIKKGSAHLLEHYVCENTIYGNLLDNLRKCGIINCNAGTSRDNTSYFFTTVVNFYDCLDIFLNGIYNIDFTKNKLIKTKKAVFSEIRDASSDEMRKMSNKRLNGLFSINNDTLGNKSSVSSIKIDELKNIYDSIYIPCNQLLLLAGNFDFDRTLDIVKKFYSGIIFKSNRKLPKVIDKKEIIKKKIIYDSDLMDEVTISFKIDTSGLSSFDKYKFDWYLNFFLDINFSKYSKINEYIINDSNYMDNIIGGLYRFNGYYVVSITTLTKNVNDYLKLLLFFIKNRDKQEEYIFELVKKDAITRVAVRKDNISDYVIPIVDNYITFDYLDDDSVDVIDKFNYDEYNRFINNSLFSNYSIFYRRKK